MRRQTTEVLPSPYPPVRVSLVRGLAAAARPLPLAMTFLGLLAVWGAYALAGVPLSPRLLVNILSIPPVQTYFDVALATSVPLGTVPLIALFGSLMAGRALLLAGLGLLLSLALGWEREGSATRRLLRSALTMFLVLSVEAAAILAVPLLARSLGAGIEVLAFFGILVGGLFILGLVPAIASIEGDPAASILRKSARAARLPSGRHLLLVAGYVSFLLWISVITPTSQVAPATPGPLVWAFALVASFVHVGFLGALIHRWLAVRDRVGGEPAPRPPRRP
ncbi:MAG TPA: hypothetical protein VEA19_00360 [Actinomycetota bacterium]|nr:hypothetical protein [Actinomycetota bacterium]